MTADIQIFNEYGRVRVDFTEAEIAGLDESKVERLHTVVAASQDTEAAENELAEANKALQAAVLTVDKKTRAKARDFPPTNRLEELRRLGVWSG